KNDRDHLGAEAEEDEPAEVRLQVTGQPGEVLPEKPGQEAQREEHGGDDGELLNDHVQTVGHHRQVRVHGAADQVAVPVYQVTDADEVVVEVTEVRHALAGLPGERHHAGVEAGNHVALGRDDLADGHDLPLPVEEGPELLLGRVLQDRSLEVVDRVVEVGQHGEERVDQGIHDQVEDHDLRGGRLRGVMTADAVV